MTYKKRITYALLFSLLIHAVAVAVWTQWPEKRGVTAPAAKSEPLVVSLNPQQPQPVRRLVESAAAAERPYSMPGSSSDRPCAASDSIKRVSSVEA